MTIKIAVKSEFNKLENEFHLYDLTDRVKKCFWKKRPSEGTISRVLRKLRTLNEINYKYNRMGNKYIKIGD